MNNYDHILKAIDDAGYILTMDIPISDEMESNIFFSLFNAMVLDTFDTWEHPHAKLINQYTITRP